jgi:anti-sigma B factor antagonist
MPVATPKRLRIADRGLRIDFRFAFGGRFHSPQSTIHNQQSVTPTMITIGIHYAGTIASLDMRGKFIKGQGGFQLQMLVDKVLQAGTSKMLLNLTEVPIIDSMGIGEIVRAFKRVQEAGGALKLVGVTDRVYGALRITQLLDLIESFDTEEEALASFGKEKKARGKKKKSEEEADESESDEDSDGE